MADRDQQIVVTFVKSSLAATRLFALPVGLQQGPFAAGKPACRCLSQTDGLTD
ncbi:predicted protein [Plenodomus lingam JN3]|uniref:Predicted protein n=1 Tax=Leptosphaeria maculans (strain JN3 / isolate v23.1.3 / race Av1-4-5-6-7-8) TaxID=985895 RepID=E4ZHL6_LEPMJ|nr:predicted protein [Plenodomus lingam JN3]CBX90849.1 predicted protein [Plenodomus lingam JN3]